MSARSQLAELAAGAGQHLATFWSGRNLRFPGIDPATAREAAVLILFGTLDNRPSAFHTEAVPDDLDLLLVRRADLLRQHPGQVAFPGGAVDPGDSGAVAAALREAVEETGLDPAGVSILGELPEVPLTVSNFRVTPVLAWWDAPSPVGVVDPGESAQVFRAAVADLLDPANRRTAVVQRAGQVFKSPAFLVNGVTVWGFTALILNWLFDELGWTLDWDQNLEIPAPLPAG